MAQFTVQTSLVIFGVSLALLQSTVTGNSFSSNVNGAALFDCSSQAPVGKSASDAVSGTPPIGLLIGDANALKYTPDKPFPVKIRYAGGTVKAVFISAMTPFGSSHLPVGNWTVISGAAKVNQCSSARDTLIGQNLGTSGTIRASWTPPPGLTGWVEFKLTVLGTDGHFWFHMSALVGPT